MTRGSELYGPIYTLIQEVAACNSDEEKERLIKQLASLNEETMGKYRQFDVEIEEIRNSNIEMREKLHQYDRLLDDMQKGIQDLDMENSLISCKEMYQGYWERLEEQSKQYLATANVLHKLLTNQEKDCSPMVMEMSRAVENEIIRKVYDPFVYFISQQKRLPDKKNRYTHLAEAANDLMEFGRWYIPARTMVRYFTEIKEDKEPDGYGAALRDFLKKNGIDETTLSEESFVKNADEYFDLFRNQAAHAGTVMDTRDGKQCREKTKKVLKRFMSAV